MTALFFSCVVLLQAQQFPDREGADSTPRIERGPQSRPAGAVEQTEPLQPRSTAEWRSFFLQWRQRAVEGAPARYPLPDDEMAEIARVRDGNAAPALASLYKQERDLRVRMAYVETLSRIQTTTALQTLVQISLEDRDPRLRTLAADGIAKTQDRNTAAELYARAVRNGEHRQYALDAIERAGLASPVASSEQPNAALVTALIDSLWVIETQLVEGSYSVEYFTPAPGASLGLNYNWDYRRQLLPVRQPVIVPKVYEILKSYTKEDYGYDEGAWRQWYKRRQRQVHNKVKDSP
jgi:hypothetical protein